jgi:nucleotide-binding universal stress UspA family protein
MGSVTARVIGSSKVDVLVVPRDASIGWGRILLATDGSEFSRAALQHALNFARSYGGRLLVVSVAVMNEELLAQAPDVAEKLTERARAFAQEAQAQAEAQGVSAQVFVREGDAHQKIVEVALKEGADVIFMGSHGRTGLRKLLMGSVTEKVIGLSACPVLVVRA